MSRNFSDKIRGKQNRSIKRKIFISAEGKNKSELNYFHSVALDKGWGFKSTNQAATDPVNLARKLVQLFSGSEVRAGDLAFCLVDHDGKPIKDGQIAEAENILKQCSKVISPLLIVSNPSFEIWVLYHFQRITKAYDNKGLLMEVKKCEGLSKYEKSMNNLFDIISVKTCRAMENAKYAEEIHIDEGKQLHAADFNSSSEIYKIFEMIAAEQC